MNPGIHEAMPEATYHADADSISASGIKQILDSPAHYGIKIEPTAAMDLGTAVHSKVLGAGASTCYVDAKTWQGAEAKAARVKARAQGGTPLLVADRAVVEAMTASVNEHPAAAKLLTQPGRAELSMFWDDADWDVQRRCRWDYLTNDGIGIDLKTTSTALSDYALTRRIVDARYHLSADWYLTVAEGLDVKVRAFALIFVSSRPPYDVRVVDLSPAFLDRGRALTERALTTYRQCVADDAWPAYTDPSVTTLSLPRWAQED